MSETYFFLHGGPGMGAAMERACYPGRTDCYWWDQPRPAVSARRPFQDLLDVAESELRLQARLRGGPMTLLANSFGAVLATHLARVAPELISRLVLLAPVADLEQGMVRVARRVLALSGLSAPELQAALTAYDAAPGRESFWTMFQALLQHPGLVAQYWLPDSPRAAWFARMLALPEMFDLAAHMAIADDYQRSPLLPVPVAFAGPVDLLFGVGDALTDPVVAAAWWRRCYPQATSRLLRAAHFPHLELPLELILGPPVQHKVMVARGMGADCGVCHDC